MSFKEWLKRNEVATTTASVATYALPLGIGSVRRVSPSLITVDDLEKEKGRKDGHKKRHKKSHKKSKVLEMYPGKKVVMGDIGYF